MSVSQILLDSIDILVKDAVQKASYNSTIQATIVNCQDQVKGLYRCSYQDSKFYAYSNNTQTKYLKGAAVYVLIPNNDASQTRIILGSVDQYGAGYINQASEEERYQVIGINNITSNGVYYLNTNNKQYLQYLYTYNGGTNNVISIDNQSLAVYMKQATSVTFGAKIKTSIQTSRQFRGEYGLIFKLRFVKNTNDGYDVRTYVLNQDNMIGNPYKLITPSRQTAIYNIDGKNFDRVESIAIYNKNFPDATGNTQSGILSSGDIELSQLELLSTSIIPDSELNGTVITFYTPQGTFFSTISGDSNTKAITAQVKVQGKLLTSSQLIPFYWGRQNVGITTESRQYNPYLGRGWQCLNDSNIILTQKTEGTTVTQQEVVDWVPASDTYTVSIDDATAKNNLFKVAAIYDGNVITKTINIQNLRNATAVIEITSDSGTAFSFDIGHPTLTCTVMQGTTQLSNCTYYWGVEDSSGVFTSLPQTTNLNEDYEDAVEALQDYLEELGGNDQHLLSAQAQYLASLREAVAAYDGIQRVDGKYLRDVQISNITDFATFKCSVYRTVGTNTIYLGTASIVLTNSLEAQPGYSLVINNGTVVFKYDNEGKAPNNRNLPNPQKIEALTISVYDDKGQLLSDQIINNPNNCQIRWMFPIEDTLLTGSQYNGTPSGTDPTGKYEYYDNITTLLYDINPGYSVNKVNNQIKVSVTYKDEVTLNAETSFTFTKEGQIGANGTEYFVKLVPNTNMSSPPQYPIITYDNYLGKYYVNYGVGSSSSQTQIYTNQGYQLLKAQLYHNGERIWSGTSASGTTIEGKQISEVEWSILSNQYEKESSSITADDSAFEITAAASGGIKYKGDYLGSNYNTPKANIIKCAIEYDGKSYYGTIPITTAWVTNSYYRVGLEQNSGFRFVEYSSSGLNPQYSSQPFKFICNQWIDDAFEDISLVSGEYAVTFTSTSCGSIKEKTTSGWSQTNSNQLTLLTDSWYTDDLQDNQFVYRPVNKYNGDCVNNTVLCQVTRGTTIIAKIAVPIHFYLNRYQLSHLNDWDGNSIKLKEDEGFILAPQIGAGKKESDNSFTGVVMGQVQEGGRTTKDVGLLGYSHGIRSFFLDSQTGGAIFGKNRGKITIDPTSDQAMIYSSNFWKEYDQKGFPTGYTSSNYYINPQTDKGQGMLIDLTKPQIRWGNGNVLIDQHGYFSFGDGDNNKITFDQNGLKVRATQVTMGGYSATTANNYTTTLSRLISDIATFTGIYPFEDILDQYDVQDGDLALDSYTRVVYKYNYSLRTWEATSMGEQDFTNIKDIFDSFNDTHDIHTYSYYMDPVDYAYGSQPEREHVGDIWHYTGISVIIDMHYWDGGYSGYIQPGHYYQLTERETPNYFYWKQISVSDTLKKLVDNEVTLFARDSRDEDVSHYTGLKEGDFLYVKPYKEFYRWHSQKKKWITLQNYERLYTQFMQFYAGSQGDPGGLLIGDLYNYGTGGAADIKYTPSTIPTGNYNAFLTNNGLQFRNGTTVLAQYSSTGITFNDDVDFTIGDNNNYIQWNSNSGQITICAQSILFGPSKKSVADIGDSGALHMNLVKNGYWPQDFIINYSLYGWAKQSSATLSYDDSTGLVGITCSSSYYGLTQSVTLKANTKYVISAQVGSSFQIGFGTGSYPTDSGSWSTDNRDGRKYKVITTGSSTSYTVYVYATSSSPCYANRIKVEQGDTHTGWYAQEDEGIDTTSQYMEFNGAAASSGGGLYVYSGNKSSSTYNTNYVKINSAGIYMVKSGDDTGVFDSAGLTIYGQIDGTTRGEIAKIYSGDGNDGSGETRKAPYYTFGTRKSGYIKGNYSVAEGYDVRASGYCSYAGGYDTFAGEYSHAEGYKTYAKSYGHAEGNETTANGKNSHAQGKSTTASNINDHAEGNNTTAKGYHSHAEGSYTSAEQICAHSEGYDTHALGYYSHSGGEGTIAQGMSQTAIGMYNVASGTYNQKVGSYYSLIVGNGNSDSSRSNALALDWDGNLRIKGDIYFGCSNDSSGGTDLSNSLVFRGDAPSNLNNATTTGIYYIQGTAPTNGPKEGDNGIIWASLIVINMTGMIEQIVVKGGTGRIYTREYSGNPLVWSAWARNNV